MPKLIDLTLSPSPGDEIEIEQLQHYVDRYKLERYKHIVAHINDDSRGAWISKEKIQEFLTNNPDADGLRLYYGVIEDFHEGFEQGTHNLLLVPTQKSGTDNIDLLGNANWVIVLLNASSAAIAGDPQAALCPPPRNPCGGNGLSY